MADRAGGTEQVSEITFANPEDVTDTLKRQRDKLFRVHGRVVQISAVKSAPPGRNNNQYHSVHRQQTIP